MSENKEPLNKNNKVPKLKFDCDTNEWKCCSFSDATLLSKKKYNPITSDEDLIDIELDSIESGTGRLINKYSSKEMSSIKNAFTSNDVLYSKLRPYLRKIYKPTFSGVCSSEFWVFSPKKITQSFLYHFISTNRFNIQTNKTCGTKMPRADWNKIKELDFYYPNNETQNKMSSFLDAVDKKIVLLMLKIEALKKYKEGMTKNVFLQLEKVSYISLSSACKITTGKLDANAMSKEGKYMFFTCSRENYLINTYAFDCEAILVSGNGEVGLTKYYKGKFNAYQRTYVLYDFKVKPSFLKLCIDSQIGTVIRRETNKGAMPYIRLTTFDKIRIPKVSDTYELIIERVIGSIDSKELALKEKLKDLIAFKKQLLNMLFI